MANEHRIRFRRLNQVCDKALVQSIKQLQNWEKLTSCYPNYSSVTSGETNLRNCQKQVSEFWFNLSKQEFSEIFRERDAESKLDQLDDLILEAKQRTDTSSDIPNMSLNDLSPYQFIQGNIQSARLECIDSLDQRLGKLNQLNSNLKQELEEMGKEIEQELKELEDIYDKSLGKDLTSSSESLRKSIEDMLSQNANI